MSKLFKNVVKKGQMLLFLLWHLRQWLVNRYMFSASSHRRATAVLQRPHVKISTGNQLKKPFSFHLGWSKMYSKIARYGSCQEEA